jgi:hypothetical protein
VITLVRETPQPGRVIDAAGLPVVGATVSARPAEFSGIDIATSHSSAPDQTYGLSRTDAQGHFVLPGLRAGERYTVKVTGGSGVGDLERAVVVTGTPIDIQLMAAAPVTLALTGLRGAPAPAGQRDLTALGREVLMRNSDLGPNGPGPGLSLEWQDPGTGNWQVVSSPRRVVWGDSDHAELHFERVPAGSVRVVVGGDFAIATDVFTPVTVVGGMPLVLPVRLVANHELRLRVTNAQGAPVSGARVEVFSHTGRSSSYTNTSADGTVTFRVHPEHDVKVTVSAGGKSVSTTVSGNSPDPVAIVIR